MNTAQTTKNLAKQIAKQMAREPLEVLKTARGQVTGETVKPPESSPQASAPDVENKIVQNKQELADKIKGGRQMEAFLRELEDIRKQNIFGQLQRRIAEGEEIALSDYTGLSMEQKQVLNAQMEVVKNQIEMQKNSAGKTLEVPVSKRGRRFGPTQKQEAEKQQTRVEKPVPPSG